MEFTHKKQAALLAKIAKRKEEISNYMISNATTITDIVYRETKEFEKYEDAVTASGYRPIQVGELWGGGTNGWFKLKFSIPKDWKGKEVAAFINISGEACAFIGGKPYQGVDPNHEEIILARSAKGGEAFEIVLDARSGKWYDTKEWETEPKVLPSRLVRAEIATRNSEVREYWFNLDMLHLLAEQLPENSPRRARIVYTLNKSVDAFDYTHTDEASLRESALRANALLKPLLDCPAEPSATNIAVHGHSHIDVAWLWPYSETIRKCSRTFSSVMRLMEQYPEYIFTQSQAQLYEFTKTHYPSIYEEIKKRVKEGRWDVEGSMWVEADCNLCSGESLVRQILVGKNYFKDEFGIETDVLWLPDVFGYAAALPQILKKAGVNYFSTIKINWSQFNRFPYSTFYWKGIDGTSVLTHFPPAGDYNAFPTPEQLRKQVDLFAEKDRCDWSLMSYGWGDGGGGPDKRHLEMLRRAKDLEGLPRCKQMKVSEFFHTIDGTEDLPEWSGELYLELHRGTYTTQGRNKKYNRQAELLYRDAELLGSIAAPMGFEYPRERLLTEWKRILCNQFHDVIPGSSIRLVYEDTDVMYPEILAVGRETASSAMETIARKVDTSGEGSAVVVFNTLPWDRRDIAVISTLDDKGSYAVFDSAGNEVPSQQKAGEISFVADVPSMGYSTYHLVKKAPAKVKNSLKVSKKGFENAFYKIELDANGTIASLIHKATGRELLPEGKRGNLLQIFEDKPADWDAWDIDFYYEDKWEDVTGLDSIEIVEDGPVSAAIEMTRSYNKSKIRQKMVVYADNPRIDFQTWVDWHEDEKCLKVAFPVDVNTTKARYEIQFGNVERPTHTNTSWDFARFEVCAHRWADISEQGFGMSLLNDCKYGHHTKGNAMRLTLLRSPKEPDAMADMGEHTFTYSILPHGGDYVEAGTVRQGYELNVPLKSIVVKPSKGELPATRSFFSVDAENVILETVKKAEKEEATILRFYECHNQRASVNVKIDVPFKKVYECDLMEKNIGTVEARDGGFSFEVKPFEIRTFKLV